MKTLLRAKLEDKSAVIAIIGLGYVGLPLALAFSEQGFKTIGYDTSVEKIERLQNGVSDILDIGSERLNRNLLAGNFLINTACKRAFRGGCSFNLCPYTAK